MAVYIHLEPGQFIQQEKVLASQDGLSASLFRFPSGVCALRLKNELGDLVTLPFQGQQIWDAHMRGRRLTMKSMFEQPYPTRDFLSTYGAFLLHCGATAMGVPAKEDTHPLHGELHNAPYQSASVLFAEDEHGKYIGLTGVYRHTIAFNYNYIAEPLIKLYSGSSIFRVSMTIRNLKATPMPLMFLEHINFIPVNDGRLVQTVPCDSENMKVRANIPAFMDVAPGYREFVALLQQSPQKHLVFEPDLVYDPEMVLFMKYLFDESGWARTMQIHPDGTADIVRHRPDQLDHAIRWICRTPDQDALGIEPSTAEVEGYIAEKEKGFVRSLAGGAVFRSDLEIGVLTPDEAILEEILISNTLSDGEL